MSAEANQRMGDYEILGELGAGGMGRVYRVRNVLSDRIEAAKVLLPDLAGRQELAARFLREIKVLASLNHPNIAQLRTAITIDNQLVMIMEYVEGTSLAARVERGPIAPAEALNYIDQVLDALSYAHKQHVIHRDIKPANMMLTPHGVVKLMDFGIARTAEDRGLTMTGSTLGSLSYMSPEQTLGQGTDVRSDLYSVGVSLYEMVTGQRPFQGDSDFSIMTAQVKETPRAPLELQPGLPAALNEIILMAMAKDPGQRFQTADAMRNALGNVRGSMPAAKPGTRPATAFDTPIPAHLGDTTATVAAAAAGVRPAATTFEAHVTPRPISTGTVIDARVTPRPSSTGTVLDARVTPVTPTPPPPPPVKSHRGLYMGWEPRLCWRRWSSPESICRNTAAPTQGPRPLPRTQPKPRRYLHLPQARPQRLRRSLTRRRDRTPPRLRRRSWRWRKRKRKPPRPRQPSRQSWLRSSRWS